MVDAIQKIMEKLPPLSGSRSPNLAALLGFLFGGVGLGLYFLSFVDFIIPVGIAIALTVISTKLGGLEGFLGILAGMIIAALWGYFRADNSNRRLRAGSPG